MMGLFAGQRLNKHVCAGFWILLISASVHAQSSPSALDLKTALEVAESSNLELQAARQQRAIRLAGLKMAGQIPNPIISFAAARDTPHESVLWDQVVELGGKRGKRIAVGREEQKATEIDITLLSRNIRQRTREAFYRVLWSRAQTEQAKAALELATRIRDIVQQRFEAGDVAQLEVIQSQVELERATADYDLTAQAEKIAAAQFAALLNRPLDTPWNLQGRLSDIPGPESLEALTATALRSSAEIQRTTQELQVEQRRLALAKAQRIPNLDLQAGADLNSPPDFNVGPRGQIGISLPIFYRGQGEVAQSTAQLDFLRLSLQALRTIASAQVVGAYFDYTGKVRQTAQYDKRIVPQTMRLQEMAEDSYRSGKSNLLTLIDAQRRLNETRRAYLDSLFTVQSSFAALEEVVGTPLD
jgi:cobalt-zinc-cadmium efflux system outer membrane protein